MNEFHSDFLIEISHSFAPLLCFSLLDRHGGHYPGFVVVVVAVLQGI